MTRPSRDETWLQVAEVIAQRGTCPRRKVGCVIVDYHGRVMATGYNGSASGRPHCSEGPRCPGAPLPSGIGLEKCEAIHAEQNACLLLTDPWAVESIYCTASPCLSCVKLLLGTSAKRIVCREIYPHPDAIEWWARAGRQLIHVPLVKETSIPEQEIFERGWEECEDYLREDCGINITEQNRAHMMGAWEKFLKDREETYGPV
jgi:dCMP deaminase